jgi:NAD(P)-dependent dehydrogenase (short-subunit alcohol dehydrogenase family)
MQNILIAGASRGIGLALVKGYLEQGDQVFAVVRRAGNEALDTLGQQHPGRLRQITCDLAADDAPSVISSALGTATLNVALFNAGISGSQDIDGISSTDIGALFMINAVAPVRIARAIKDQVTVDGVIAFTSSQMGSVALARSATMPMYGASKAALNSLLQSWSQADDKPASTLLALHPGWVKTDMGGDNAPVEVTDSAAGLIKTVALFQKRGGCHFADYQQQTLAW